LPSGPFERRGLAEFVRADRVLGGKSRTRAVVRADAVWIAVLKEAQIDRCTTISKRDARADRAIF
jgi:hypothetical protein